jgi:cell division protein FtsI/penicillin-binding protein 2
MTVKKHRVYGYKNTVKRLQNTVYALIAVNSGVYYSRTFLTRWEKNRVKNAEKPAVFSAKKRENRLLF